MLIKIKSRYRWGLIILLLITQTTFAADLIQVFRQALTADPQLKMAKSNQLAIQQNIPINRAALLPGLSGAGQLMQQSASSFSNISTNTSTLSLDVSQPVFNAAHWLNYKVAKINSKAAEASYGAAVQDLIIRTAQAYFDVLQAQDQLQLSQANHDTLNVNLQQTTLRFHAGLVKRVDVDDAQAAVEGSVADIITNQNMLMEKKTQLQQITGIDYSALTPLRTDIPLIKPHPLDLQSWLNVVNRKNLTVLADRDLANADKMKIKMERAGHYPTLDAGGGVTHSDSNSVLYPVGDTAQVNLVLSVPIYTGGKVNAQTRQQAYYYETQLEQTKQDYRTAIAQAQTSYYGVINGISKIMADQRAIVANEQALKSTKIAYQAGLSNNNIMNVLNVQQTLYQTQQAAAADRYSYIMNLLKLKQAAGTLSVMDLVELNRWLK